MRPRRVLPKNAPVVLFACTYQRRAQLAAALRARAAALRARAVVGAPVRALRRTAATQTPTTAGWPEGRLSVDWRWANYQRQD
jgi:hypothetical protein